MTLSNPRSLRYRALLVVVAVVVLPLVWVWAAGTLEAGGEMLQRRALSEIAASAASALTEGRDLGPVAHRNEIHLRVLSRAGDVIVDLDETDERNLLTPLAEPFYGPAGRPKLGRVDARMPVLPLRPEVVASKSKPSSRCSIEEDGRILVCSAAHGLRDGRVVHVMRGSARLVRSLYEQRFQLTALTLLVLVVGISLSLWLGWRMVGPIEQLRDQVVARTRGRLSTEPVVLERKDELGELADAFNQLLAALDERNKANTVFAADLAHELKNPVAAVQAAAEAMAADKPIEGERRARLARVLADASRRMEIVVHQFLELARAEAGLYGAVREPIDVFSMASEIVRSASNDERYRSVSFEITGESVLVEAVPERLETAVRNLVSNAGHYAQLGAEQRAGVGRVEVGVLLYAELVEICVRDDGPGVGPEDLPQLFTRYRTRRDGGTGLGLPMTKAKGHDVSSMSIR